jgi:hypothetical protein
MTDDIHSDAPRGFRLVPLRRRLAALLTGPAGGAFIDDLGRPRLVHPGPRLTEITLEVDPRAEPIAGSLREGKGVRRPFAGWIGLAAALEATLGGGSRGQ